MTLELASRRAVEKPWGRTDLRPWSEAGGANCKIGEIWYERTDPAAHEPSLLLKLLFTLEPLSVQVHPGDAFARLIGEARGKSEAWYVLSAEPDARIALGLDRRLTSEQLREAIADGSIAKRIAWRKVACGDVVDVPSGSIHAIGAGSSSPKSSRGATRPFVSSIMGDPAGCTLSRPSRSPMPGWRRLVRSRRLWGQGGRYSSDPPTSSLKRSTLLHARIDNPGAAGNLAARPKRQCPCRTAERGPGRGGLPRG